MININDLENLNHIRIDKADLTTIWEYDKKGFIVISNKNNIIEDKTCSYKLKRVYDTKGFHKTYSLEPKNIKKDFSNFNIIMRFIKRHKDYSLGYSEGFLYLNSKNINIKVVA